MNPLIDIMVVLHCIGCNKSETLYGGNKSKIYFSFLSLPGGSTIDNIIRRARCVIFLII